MAEIRSSKGYIVTFAGNNPESVAKHEIARIADLSNIIATMKGYIFSGEFQGGRQLYDGELYFVPYKTIIGREFAASIGIQGKNDLFGGITPYPYMITKAIAHGTPTEISKHPEGWNADFAETTTSVVLPGYTVFDLNDALLATERLLQRGLVVRGKRTLAAGGSDQFVISTLNELEPVLKKISPYELARYGFVLESNLQNESLITRNLGQVELSGIVISYVGLQRGISGHDGNMYFGGSDLLIARGGFTELLKYVEDPQTRLAIQQAKAFDEAAESLLGIIASRRNYDIAQGFDANGSFSSGVLVEFLSSPGELEE